MLTDRRITSLIPFVSQFEVGKKWNKSVT